MAETTAFDTWCIVEILGRKVVAGRVTEQVIAGQGFIRVDVPAVNDQTGFTQLYGPGSIYAITPTTEEIATAFVARNVGAPIQPWQLALPEKASERETEDDPEYRLYHCPDCQKDVPFELWEESQNVCTDCAAPF
jgi:hypothetical protein